MLKALFHYVCVMEIQHYSSLFICTHAFVGRQGPFKLDWGCGSCGLQIVPGRPAVPQSWQEKEDVEDEKGEEDEEEEAMWPRMTAKQTKRKEERDCYCHQIFTATLYQHEIRAVGTHLMSWLYLARRSDRQGAPVFICRDSFIMMTDWIWLLWLFGYV